MSQSEPNSESIKRERIVLECIRKNPELHHNALLKLIVPEFMAKTTFEKTRDSLLGKNLISVKTKGNMKFYLPASDYEAKLLQHFEKITNLSFHNLKNSLRRFGVDYHHKDMSEKIHPMSGLQSWILQKTPKKRCTKTSIWRYSR